jgi:hypothetical protein
VNASFILRSRFASSAARRAALDCGDRNCDSSTGTVVTRVSEVIASAAVLLVLSVALLVLVKASVELVTASRIAETADAVVSCGCALHPAS